MKWLVGAIMSVVVSQAANAEWKDWRKVEGWNIQRNLEDQACQLGSIYEGDGETILLLTYTPSSDTANLTVGNRGWTSLKEGDDPKVSVDMGPVGRWSEVSTRSFVTEDYRWLSLYFNGADFLRDFGNAARVSITRGDVVVDKLALKGSRAASAALAECASAINKGIARDPFKK